MQESFAALIHRGERLREIEGRKEGFLREQWKAKLLYSVLPPDL
jgi:hypothetical protein